MEKRWRDKLSNLFSFRKIIYYSAIGLIVNISSLIIYFSLVEFLGFKYQISWLFSYGFALTTSFLLNNYLTFKLRDFPFNRFLKFIFANTGFGVISLLGLLFLVEIININYFLSQVIVILLFFPISFFYASKKVFL